MDAKWSRPSVCFSLPQSMHDKIYLSRTTSASKKPEGHENCLHSKIACRDPTPATKTGTSIGTHMRQALGSEHPSGELFYNRCTCNVRYSATRSEMKRRMFHGICKCIADHNGGI